MEIKQEPTNYGFNTFTVFFFIILCIKLIYCFFIDFMMYLGKWDLANNSFLLLDAVFSLIMFIGTILIFYRKMLGVIILFGTSFLSMIINISAFSDIISSGEAIRNSLGLIILSSGMLMLKDEGTSGWTILQDKL